jgi:hypothetical protein
MRKQAVWALDFGDESVIAVAAEEKNPGEWKFLGGGEAGAHGVKNGEIEKLTDAVESVVEAVRKAEKNSRRRCRQIYYNFDDPGMRSVHPRGVKMLGGEGQITRSDVREAAQSALRLVGDFERAPVYSREIDYVIDDKDPVGNPIGVFGNRLDVVLHVLLARSGHLEQWKKLISRAEIDRGIPVPSLVSAFCGLLEKKAPRRIVWDLGRCLIAGGVVEKNTLLEYTVFLKSSLNEAELVERITASSRSWADQYGILDPLVLTGNFDAHARLLQKIETLMGLKAIWPSPKVFSDFNDSKYASVAGLFKIAEESQRSRPGAKIKKNLVGQVRERVSALMQEYF